MVAELQILALGVAGTAAAAGLGVVSARVWFETERFVAALAWFVPLAFAGAFGPSLAAVFAAQSILDDQTPGLAAASLLVLAVIIPPLVYLWARHIEVRRYRRETHGRRNLWGR
jgi:hypothetical protein